MTRTTVLPGRTPTREGRSTRRRVAALLALEPRSAREIADALGRKDGGIRSVLNAMRAEGHLQPAKRPRGRAAVWELTPSGRRALLGAQTRRPAGVLTAGMRLVLVGERSVGLPVEALREVAGLPGFAWGATLYGGARFIAAFDSDAGVERMRQAVAADGGDTVVALVSDLFDAAALAHYVDEAVGTDAVRSLPGSTRRGDEPDPR